MPFDATSRCDWLIGIALIFLSQFGEMQIEFAEKTLFGSGSIGEMAKLCPSPYMMRRIAGKVIEGIL